MMNSTIAEADRKDIPLLTRLIRASHEDVADQFHLFPSNCPTHPSFYTEDKVGKDFGKGLRYFIIKAENSPVGCVAMETAGTDTVYLERLSVLPDWRHYGFGEALVKRVFIESLRASISRVEIGIIGEHRMLENWYARLGFVKKNTVAFDHLPFTVTYMFINLQPPDNGQRFD
jgi:predicted N-acetyltransferase YhbS